MDTKLFYLGDIKGMTEAQMIEAEAFIGKQIYGIVATNNPETGARLSGLNNLRGQNLGTLHYGTDATSQKAMNIAANPRIEVMYTDGNFGQIILSGKAEIVTDTATKESVWEEWMNEYSPEGPTGNGLCIIRFKPESIRAMLP